MPVFVANDVGILGSMRRKLQARFVCAQLPQDGLPSSHYFLVKNLRIMCCFRYSEADDGYIFGDNLRINTHLDMSLLALHTSITRFSMESSCISIQSSLRHCIGSDFPVDCTKHVFYHMVAHRMKRSESIRKKNPPRRIF
jgi:hypothetical protein